MKLSSYTTDEYFELRLNDSAFRDMPIHDGPMQPLMIALSVTYGTLFVAGAFANFWTAWVIGVVLCDRRNDVPRNVQIYIFVLCCADLVILASLLLLLSDLIWGYWIVGSTFLCYIYLFSEALNKFFGPFILTALSATCYSGVCRGTPKQRTKQQETIIACCISAFCVILAVCLTSPVYVYGDVHYLVVHNESTYSFYMPKCTFSPPETLYNIFTIYTFIFGYAVPALLFTMFYSAVLCFLHRRSRTIAVGNSSSYFWKVAKTALGLVLFYLVCWTPYWANTLYNLFATLSGPISNLTIYMNYIIHLLPYINCAGYPILYTMLNRDIQKVYQRVKERRNQNKHVVKALPRLITLWASIPAQAGASFSHKGSIDFNSTLIINAGSPKVGRDSKTSGIFI